MYNPKHIAKGTRLVCNEDLEMSKAVTDLQEEQKAAKKAKTEAKGGKAETEAKTEAKGGKADPSKPESR